MTTRVAVRSAAHAPRPVRPPIDPRIHARRIAVRRAEGRRRLHWLLAAGGVLALGGAAVGAVFSPVLDVNGVVVRGAAAPDVPAVTAAAEVTIGAPVLLLDLGAAEQRVEALAAVESAVVERELPGTVRITVTMRTPVAWVRQADGTAVLVDRSGVVTAEAPVPPAGIPEILNAGPRLVPGGRIDDEALAHVVAAVPPELRGQFASVWSTASGEISLVVAGGPAIRIGGPHQIEAKVRVALAVLGVAGSVSFIDVRVPTAPVAG